MMQEYRQRWYAERGLPVLEFAGGDLLSLPVQHAAMMVQKPMENGQSAKEL